MTCPNAFCYCKYNNNNKLFCWLYHLLTLNSVSRDCVIQVTNAQKQYNTIQYNTIQYNIIQYNTIQYNTIQYNTVQHITMLVNQDYNRWYWKHSHRNWNTPRVSVHFFQTLWMLTFDFQFSKHLVYFTCHTCKLLRKSVTGDLFTINHEWRTNSFTVVLPLLWWGSDE